MLEVYEYASIHFFKENKKNSTNIYIISKNLEPHKKSQFFATTVHVAYYEL